MPDLTLARDGLPEQATAAQVLTFLDNVRGALEWAQSIEDAGLVVTRAQAVRYLADKVEAADEVRFQAGELVVDARRKHGKLLAQRDKPVGGRGLKSSANVAGVSRDERLRQQEAQVPDELVDDYKQRSRSEGRAPNPSGLRRAAGEPAPDASAQAWATADRFVKTCRKLTDQTDGALAAIRFGHYPGDSPTVDRYVVDALAEAKASITTVQKALR